MDALTTGFENVAIGSNTGGALTTGCSNVAIGCGALDTSVSGSFNIAIGRGPMRGLLTGNDNIAMGRDTFKIATSGACNVAMGFYAMNAATTGCKNVAIGKNALGNATVVGFSNIAIGEQSAQCSVGGSYNVSIGFCAGCQVSGENNTSIGYRAGASVTNACHVINIGTSANVSTNCYACISATVLSSEAGTDMTSDCRSKCSIADSDLGLDFIKALRPVKYRKRDPARFDSDGNMIFQGDGGRLTEQTSYGLLGQEVQQVLTDAGKSYNDFIGVNDILQEKVTFNSKGKPRQIGTIEQMNKEPEKYFAPGQQDYDPDHPDGLYQKTIRLNHIQFLAPMMKATQELDTALTALTERVAALE
jgi:hypothetical protein